MSEHIEYRDGKPVVVSDRTEPPGKRTDLLRGSFAIVEHTDLVDGQGEIRMVLLSFEPNRKLVFDVSDLRERLHGKNDLGPFTIHLTQDSPGMARE